MDVLLYFGFHDYSKVEMWYNKKISSLPERVSAPDRFVFFLFSTTMRSPSVCIDGESTTHFMPN